MHIAPLSSKQLRKAPKVCSLDFSRLLHGTWWCANLSQLQKPEMKTSATQRWSDVVLEAVVIVVELSMPRHNMLPSGKMLSPPPWTGWTRRDWNSFAVILTSYLILLLVHVCRKMNWMISYLHSSFTVLNRVFAAISWFSYVACHRFLQLKQSSDNQEHEKMHIQGRDCMLALSMFAGPALLS